MSIMTRKQSQQTKTGLLQRLISNRDVSLFAVLIAVYVFFAIASDRFANTATLSQILSSMSIVVIVGIGLALVLMTRNIDVSVGSMIGLTAFVTAELAVSNPNLSPILIIAFSAGLGLALGSFNGLIVATLRVPSIMVTLGTLYIFRGITSMIAGSRQVAAHALEKPYSGIIDWSFLGVPALVIYAFGLAIIAHLVIKYTFTGRSVMAVGSNPKAAETVGIKSKRLVFGAFALSGLLCGIVGVLWGARYGSVDSSVASGYELVVLAAVVVGGVSVNGGVGTITGVVIGAAILSVIANGLGLLNVSQFWLEAIQGGVIVIAIVTDSIIRKRMEAKGVPA